MNDAVNTSAYKQEYERLLKPLMRIAFGVALHLTRNRDDAEDLVQETPPGDVLPQTKGGN